MYCRGGLLTWDGGESPSTAALHLGFVEWSNRDALSSFCLVTTVSLSCSEYLKISLHDAFPSQSVLCFSCKIHLWQRLSEYSIVDSGYRSCLLGNL